MSRYVLYTYMQKNYTSTQKLSHQAQLICDTKIREQHEIYYYF